MRLHVINMRTRADRRAQFVAWNKRPDIEIAFVDAAIGASLDRNDLVAKGVIAKENGHLTTGALGCALSHQRLWLEASAAQAPYFVCEDDACLRGDFVQQAEGLLAQIGAGWDIVYFGYNTNATTAVQSPDRLKTLLRFDERAKQAPGYFETYARSKAPAPTALQCFQAWGTLCYAISPQGARRLLQACFPLSAATEITMFDAPRTMPPFGIDGMINLAVQRQPVTAYCAFPPLAMSANDPADSDVLR